MNNIGWRVKAPVEGAAGPAPHLFSSHCVFSHRGQTGM